MSYDSELYQNESDIEALPKDTLNKKKVLPKLKPIIHHKLPSNICPVQELVLQSEVQFTSHLSTINRIIVQDTYYRTIENAKALIISVYNYVGGNRLLPFDTITKIGLYLKNDGYTYYAKKDFDNDPLIKQHIVKLINIGFKFHPHYFMHLMELYPDLIDPIMKLYNNTIDYQFISYVESSNSGSSIMTDALMTELIDKKKISVKFTSSERDVYIKKPSADSYIICALLDDRSIEITEQFTISVALTRKLVLLKQTIMCGGILNQEILLNACKSNVDRYNKVKFILENKIQPTSAIFHAVLKSIPEKIFGFTNGRYGKDPIKKNIDTTSNQAIIDLLIDYGYKVSYDDVKDALKQKIIIKNIEQFDIKFDISYLQICAEIGLYPYKTPDLSPDLSCLIVECKKVGNLTNIKKLINEYKLVPDAACMQAASKHRSNIQTLKFLVEKGGIIDIDCFKNTIRTFGNKVLNFYICEFERHNNITIKPSAKISDKAIKKIKKDSDSDHELSEDDKIIPDQDQENKNIIDDNQIDDDKIDDDQIDEPLIKKEHEKKKTKIVKIIKKPLKTVKVIKDDDKDKIIKGDDKDVKDDKKTKKITISPNNTDKVVVNENIVNKKQPILIPADMSLSDSVYLKIPQEIKKLLKITASDKSINYIDYKNRLIKYLHNNDMIIDKKITLKTPLLYDGSDTVPFKELNEWAYSLLLSDNKSDNESDTKSKKSKKNDTINDVEDDEDDEDNNDEDNNDQENVKEKIASILEIDDISESRRVKHTKTKNKPSKKTVVKDEDDKDKKILKSTKTTKKIVKSNNKNKIKKVIIESESDNEDDDDNDEDKESIISDNSEISDAKPIKKKNIKGKDVSESDDSVEIVETKKTKTKTTKTTKTSKTTQPDKESKSTKTTKSTKLNKDTKIDTKPTKTTAKSKKNKDIDESMLVEY